MKKIEDEKLTIYEVESLQKKLAEWLEETDEVLSIDVGNVRKIDMSAIQLFISVFKTLQHSSRNLVFENITDEVQQAFKIAGVDSYLRGNKA